ncbi:MAG TPA: RsmE family RNA methyltransferase [bacterium]|nr:RsmE family RNA methyltransferase [bacterium]
MIYLVREELIIQDGYIFVSNDEARYLLKVRRLKNGAEVTFCSNGKTYFTELEINKKVPCFKIVKEKDVTGPSTRIIVAIATGDVNAIEESIRNGVEAGADEFYIFRTDLSNTCLTVIEKKMKRLNTIVVSAASQSRRGHLPEINISSFDEIAELEGDHIVLHPYSANNIVQYKPSPDRKIILWIGPEGGFTQREIDKFRSKKFNIFSIKVPILRMENAVTVLTAFIRNMS